MRNYFFLLFAFLLLTVSCKDDETLETQDDFISKDDSNPKIVRKYKLWRVSSGSFAKEQAAILNYTQGQAIQGKFDPSKITFLFYNNPKEFNGTDITGKSNAGAWEINNKSGYLRFSTNADGLDSLKIEKLDRTDLVLKTEEVDELDNKKVVIVLNLKAAL
jgi:hypothetical protein